MFHNRVIKMRVFSLVGKACSSVAFALFFGLLAGVAHAAEVRSASTTNLAPLLTYSIKRPHAGDTDITYYLSRPKEKIDFPIVVLIGGSSDHNNAASITQFHRYFLRNFDAVGAAALTVEQWGITEHAIDKKIFMAHYTRTQRLQDHRAVIEHIRRYPPRGWNGKLALLAVSEGGNIAVTLAADPNVPVSATAIWSGAGNWSWRDELWAFMRQACSEESAKDEAECQNVSTRQQFDSRLDEVFLHPSSQLYYSNMTNMYMSDAMTYPKPAYKNIHGKLLVVSGVRDTLIQSSDDFYKKAKQAGVNITYWRIEDMDHSIRKRPELIERSFEWMKQQLQ
jgi:dienelactone hydrolase